MGIFFIISRTQQFSPGAARREFVALGWGTFPTQNHYSFLPTYGPKPCVVPPPDTCMCPGSKPWYCCLVIYDILVNNIDESKIQRFPLRHAKSAKAKVVVQTLDHRRALTILTCVGMSKREIFSSFQFSL